MPYLERLGISHLYSSPILKSRPGSTHGYDVADPTTVDPELGSDDDRKALVQILHGKSMGLLLDIVPNHMGIGPANPYWEDVLTWGRRSRYAAWFDIDWNTPDEEHTGRLVLPVLGDGREKRSGAESSPCPGSPAAIVWLTSTAVGRSIPRPWGRSKTGSGRVGCSRRFRRAAKESVA